MSCNAQHESQGLFKIQKKLAKITENKQKIWKYVNVKPI